MMADGGQTAGGGGGGGVAVEEVFWRTFDKRKSAEHSLPEEEEVV